MDAHLTALLGDGNDLVVASCGVGATDGTRATREARETMAQRGLNITEHRARLADAAIARGARMILCMEPSQVTIMQGLAPQARVELLAGGVEDPMGCGSWVYGSVANKMEDAIVPIARQIAAERGADLQASTKEEPRS